MAAMWPLSLTPQYDENAAPLAGAKAYFFESGTTTPLTTYTEASLGVSHDHPVEADGMGRFPAVFFNQADLTYRVRVLDSADQVIFDVDEIDIPLGASYTPPDAGDVSPELLITTGMLVCAYQTGTKAGYVRANGRTIGSASSGASERANADCEDLFEHLWDEDSNLSVSGGRGANAASDWAANKTITLPDFRDRIIIGLGDMGNSDANRIADTLTDDDNTTLGATAGASTHTLTTAQIPGHTHTFSGTTSTDGAHTHTSQIGGADANGGIAADGAGPVTGNAPTTGDGAHNHTYSGTTSSTGSGEAHNNIQPGMFATIYIKL